MPGPRYMLFFTTTNTVEDAQRIARHLVEQRLVACVNIIPSITSVYWWKEAVAEDQETLMIIKTTSEKAPELEKSIRSIHKYEVPELIGIELGYGLPEYLNWIDSTVSKK